jgi:hypothetical protein
MQYSTRVHITDVCTRIFVAAYSHFYNNRVCQQVGKRRDEAEFVTKVCIRIYVAAYSHVYNNNNSIATLIRLLVYCCFTAALLLLLLQYSQYCLFFGLNTSNTGL